MTQGQGSAVWRRLRELRGFAFDLDGTIWEGPRLLPGATALVEAIRGEGLGIVFASNSSRHASAVLRGRLAELGIVAASQEMLAALDLAGEEVRRRLGPVRILAIGTDELDEILRSCGHTIVPDEEWNDAQAVVVGIDLLPTDPIDGAVLLQLDFLADEAPDRLREALGGPADLVLSDMAANTVGHPQTDHLRTMALVEACYQSGAVPGAVIARLPDKGA